MTQILFDDKTIMTFITPDKILHRFYPSIIKTIVPKYRVYHKKPASAEFLVGETSPILPYSHVLCYEPCYTKEHEITVMGGVTRFMYSLTDKALSYVKYTKFINMAVDEDTWDVLLHYWVDMEEGSKGATGVLAAEKVGEPFNKTTGETNTKMMRAMAFSRGHYYGVYDDKSGVLTWNPTYIFEPPQVVEVVAVWNEDNEAEQVLDIHNELNEH